MKIVVLLQKITLHKKILAEEGKKKDDTHERRKRSTMVQGIGSD